MAYPFLHHDIRLRSSPDLPLPVPTTLHPSRAGWINHGIRLYKENFGEADYLKYSREQFGLPLPPSGPEGRKALRAISRKLAFGFAMNGLKVGRRSTHMPGVGATGTLTVLANPDVPENDFFVPGRQFPIRLRHSNAAFVDDAGVVPRGCALKFTNSPTGGPLDLVFNSGIAGEIFSMPAISGTSPWRASRSRRPSGRHRRNTFVGIRRRSSAPSTRIARRHLHTPT